MTHQGGLYLLDIFWRFENASDVPSVQFVEANFG